MPLVKASPRRSAACVSAALLALIAVTASWTSGQVEVWSSAAAQFPPQPTETADLVVDFDDGRVETRRVVVEPDTTGMTVLERSGLDVTTQGALVCAIGGVGCPADDCFCEPDRFWAYYHLGDESEWVFSEEGAGTYPVVAGDVEGWVWSGTRPPITTTVEARGVAVGHHWLKSQLLDDGSVAGHAGLTADAVIASRVAGTSLRTSMGESMGASLGAPRGMSLSESRGSSLGMSQSASHGVSLVSSLGSSDRAEAPTAVDYLASQADAYSSIGAAQAGKLAVAAAAANMHPTRFGGVNLVSRIAESYHADTGQYGVTNWDQAWAMMGLASAGAEVPAEAASRLARQSVAGGWGVGEGSGPEADSTGLVMQALIAAGVPITSTSLVDALAFLSQMQNSDGGWGHGPPDDLQSSNVNSTALAVQGILAVGESPISERWTGRDGATPVSYMLAAQLPDGRFEHWSPADLMATLQALPALAGRPLPVRSTVESVSRAAEWMSGQRSAEGGFEGFNPGATIDAVLALASAGLDPNVPSPTGATVAEYLAAQARDYTSQGPSPAGKLGTAVVALGMDPHDFGGVDVVGAISSTYGSDGRFGAGGTWDNAWAMLGLAAAGEPVPDAAVSALVDAAAPDGGWGFEAGSEEVTADSTGLAIQALVAAGMDPAAAPVRSGVDALRRLQLDDAGFAGYGGTVSASSTGYALMGLLAAGQHTGGPGWSTGGPGSDGSGIGLTRRGPLDALMAIQSFGGGFAGYSGPEDPGATYQAVPGLAGRALPIRLSRLYLPLSQRGQ